jgi:hypothetical protein
VDAQIRLSSRARDRRSSDCIPGTESVRHSLWRELGWVLRLALLPSLATAQGTVVGRVLDSLGTHGPLANATVVLVERGKYATTGTRGEFRFDSIPEGHYSLGLMHAVLDSFDLVVPPIPVTVANGQITEIVMTTPTARTAYALGCAAGLGQVTDKAALLAQLQRRKICDRLARRAALDARRAALASGDSLPADTRRMQALAPVAVTDTLRSMSLAVQHGFYERRAHGLGTFMTDSQIAKHPYSTLGLLLESVHGMHVEADIHSVVRPFLHGTASGFCAPNFYVDGTLYIRSVSAVGLSSGRGGTGSPASGGMDFNDLSLMVRPETIKGLEVYESPGTVPAQFDLFSSTGCGSIVIWTR